MYDNKSVGKLDVQEEIKQENQQSLQIEIHTDYQITKKEAKQKTCLIIFISKGLKQLKVLFLMPLDLEDLQMKANFSYHWCFQSISFDKREGSKSKIYNSESKSVFCTKNSSIESKLME
jgi:hypothetical protein